MVVPQDEIFYPTLTQIMDSCIIKLTIVFLLFQTKLPEVPHGIVPSFEIAIVIWQPLRTEQSASFFCVYSYFMDTN